MVICIFGATGMVGKQLVSQALHMGHTVRAFGRNVFTSDFPEHENLELIKGAVFDAGEVAAAIKGSDAVLSVLGGGFDGTDKSRSLGMKNVVNQMEKVGVQRIVALGGLGCLPADTDKLMMDLPEFPPEFIPVSMEHLEAYHYLLSAQLDWTFVCAPDINPAGPTGAFVVAANALPEPNLNRINSGDLALFMLQTLQKNSFSKQRVGISNNS